MAAKRFKTSDSELILEIQNAVNLEGSKSYRRPFERTVLKNRLFFLGKHWFIEDPQTGFFRDVRSLRNQQTLYKANLALGHVIRSIHTVSRARGEYQVVPSHPDRRSKRAAWASEKLFEHISYWTKLPAKQQLANLICALDGSVIWKVHWDPEMGETTRFYYPKRAEGKAAADVDEFEMQQLEQSGEYEDVPLGEAAVDVYSLFQFWWDWKARENGLDDATWCATAHLTTRDELRLKYGKKVDDIPQQDGREGNLYWAELLSFMSGQFSGGLANQAANETGRDSDDRLIVIEYWKRPRPDNGMMGRYAVMCGNVLLENRDNMYRVTKHPIPFYRQNWIDCPNRFWGISLMEQLTGPQRQYNTGRSKVIQHQNKFGAPTSYIPKRWDVPKDHVTTVPGAVVQYDHMAGGDIKYGPVPNLPKEVAENTAIARQEMAEISSQQSIDESKLPGQIRGAPALQLIIAERNKGLIMAATNYLDGQERVGRMLLGLAEKFYPKERIVHYLGPDSKYRALQFSRVDLNADLRVVYDKDRVLSDPVIERANLMELAERGIINPAENANDRLDLLEAMHFRSSDGLIEERLKEEENQEREIDEILSDPEAAHQPRADMYGEGIKPAAQPGGIPQLTPQIGYPINPWDDDSVHVKTLRRFMRTEEFRNAPQFAQQALVAHMRLHEKRLDQAMQKQMEMQAQMKGTPGQKGKPSPAKPAPAKVG